MALRHEAEFKNDRHETFYLAFYDSEYSGANPISNLNVAGSGFTLDWDGKGENTHEPIMASACTIPIYSDDSDSEDFLDAILGGQEGQFRVEIYLGATEASRKLFWSGTLFCDLTLKDEMPSLINLEATDDLGLLGEILYKDTESAEYTDTTTLIVVLCRILGKCRHLDAWGASQNFLLVSDYVQHAEMTGEPYTRKIIINHDKLRNPDENGKAQFHTCKDVLINMLQNLQARIFQADGFFWVVPLGQMASTSFTAFAYYKDGSNGNLTDRPIYAAGFGGTANKLAIVHRIPESDIQKLSGWEFGQLPPLRSVVYEHEYNGSAFDWYGLGPSNGTNITDGWSFANGSPILESGDIVSLTFAYHFSFLGWGASSGSRGRRIRFSFKYRHGTTLYGSRTASVMTDTAAQVVTANYGTAGNVVECFVPDYGAPAFNSTTSNKIQSFTAVFDRYVGADLQGTFTITFPELGSDANGATDVGFWEWEVLDEDGNVDASAPASLAVNGITDIYQMRGSATFDGDVITYKRTNTDDATRETLNLKPAILADKVGNSNPTQAVWLINDAGTYTQSTANWSNGTHTTASTSISDLTCLDIISARYEPLNTATGDFECPYYMHPGRVVPNVGNVAGYYVPMRLVYNSNAGQFTGEFCDITFSTAASSTSDDNGSDPFALSGISTAGPRTARQSLQGVAQALAFDSQRILQETQSIFQVQADSAVINEARFSALELDDLSDVVISTPQSNQILKYDGVSWRNAAQSGGGASALDDLTDVDVGSASDGQVLKYNATAGEWQASNDLGATSLPDLDDVNSALAPGGGDMLIWTTANGGQWSSATIATGIGSQINMGNLGNVSEGSGTSGNLLVDFNLSGAYWITQTPAQWAGSHLPIGLLSNVSSTTPTTGDLLQWSGTQWQPFTPFYYLTLQSSFYSSDGNGDYIPFGGTLTETTSSQYYNRYTFPAAGEVVSCQVFCTGSGAGSTTINVGKYPVPSWLDTDTQTISSANTSVEFTFTSATFSKGDQMRIWFDPTGTPAGVSISILIKITP